jgi:chromosome segregation ATPase
MDKKPEDNKPNNPPHLPPRPPVGKKPDLPKGPVPPRPGGMPKLPLPGQKPGMPGPGMPSMRPPMPNPMAGNAAPQIPPSTNPIPFNAIRPGTPPPPRSSSPAMPPTGNTPLDRELAAAESSKDNLEQKITDLEKKLMEEREKVLLASLRSKEEEAVSAKVETSIKEIQDKLRREKKEQELEESRRKAEGRVLDMERRLAEEREAWVQTLKGQLGQRDSITQEMETHFSARLKDLEYRWAQEKSALEAAVKDRESDVIRVRQEMTLKSEQEKSFWEDRVRSMSSERDKFERELDRARDKFEQEKNTMLAERQVLREAMSKLESTVKMNEEQSRMEKAAQARELESSLALVRRQAAVDIERYEKELSNLTRQFQDQSREVVEKRLAIDSMKTQISQLQSNEYALRLQLTSEKEIKDKELASMQAQMQTHLRDVIEKGIQLDALRQQLSNLQIQLGHHQARVTETTEVGQERSKRLEASVAELTQALQDKERDFKKKQQEYDLKIDETVRELNRVRIEAASERDRLQHEADARLRTLQSRLAWYDSNAKREYEVAREKVAAEVAALQTQAQQAQQKFEDMAAAQEDKNRLLEQKEAERLALAQERDGLKVELDTMRQGWRQAQSEMDTQHRSLLAQLQAEQAKVEDLQTQQASRQEEYLQTEQIRMEELRALESARNEDQLTIKKQDMELGALRRDYDVAKAKISQLQEHVNSQRQMLEERGATPIEELNVRLEETTRELEEAKQMVRKLKESARDVEKAEEIFREKERALKTIIDDKTETLAEFKTRIQSLDRQLKEQQDDADQVRASAKKQIEKTLAERETLVQEALATEKAKLTKAHQEELEQARFQAAQEAAERVRAEMPAIPMGAAVDEEQVRRQVEAELATRTEEEQTRQEAALREVKEEAKKELDKVKWENESMKEELKKAREARAQIEKEAQQLLQDAEDHYAHEMERQLSSARQDAERSKGLFTAIGRFLDIPIVDFSKKKSEPKE